MSVQLLDKTRKINKLLHNNSSTKVVFNDICQVMMECLDSNILVISKKGKVLGVSLCSGVEEIKELIDDQVGGYVDALLNDRFLSVLSTKENVNLETLGLSVKIQISIQRSLIPLRSPARDWERYSCTDFHRSTTLMTSSSASTGLQLWGWR